MRSCILLLAVIVSSGYAHEGHHHSGPDIKDINSFNDPNVVRNEQHLKEHMQQEINTDKPLTPEEMEFHYFRLHDTNNDTRLDGLEILKALMHMMPTVPTEHTHHTPEQAEDIRKKQENEMFPRFTMIIDKVLLEDDVDRDGYISYPEYISARRRDEVRMREHMANQQQYQQQHQNKPMQYQNQQHPPQQQYQNQAHYNQPSGQPNQQQFQQHPNQQYQQHPNQQYQPPNQQYQPPNQQYQPPNQQYQHQPNQHEQKVPPGINPQHYQ